MAHRGKPIKHKTTFEERLAEEARRFKEAAEEQPLGSMARKLLLRRARQAEQPRAASGWSLIPLEGMMPKRAAAKKPKARL
jgi:hypothetical protein